MSLCANPEHPRGRWHRKGDAPSKYDVRGRILAKVRTRTYGCACPPTIGRAMLTTRNAPRPSTPRLPANARMHATN